MPAKLGMRWIAAAAGLFIAFFVHAAAAQADPNELWKIVHGQCVPNEQQRGDPKPCAEVDLKAGVAGGFAVLKDIRGATQFLLIPTQQIGGIESRALLASRAANYFADAWQGRHLVEKALGHPLPRDTLSLAINSELARSQNQLHIHIDCLRADIRDELQRERSEIGRRWKPLPVLLAGHRYRAMRVSGSTLAGHNPFKLLAWGVPGAHADMGHHTLVVVGMQYAHHGAGFVILDDRADRAHGDNAGGEELQDHACVLGRTKS
jgi:CDP-diacylglycerol pyrophosphatase